MTYNKQTVGKTYRLSEGKKKYKFYLRANLIDLLVVIVKVWSYNHINIKANWN